jgi:hypothetical protein
VSQAFGTVSVKFVPAVPYSSGAEGANAVVAIDVNGDGYPDLIVATNNGVSVLVNNGDGTFAPSATYSSGGPFSNALAVVDVNGDGNLDIVITNECLDTLYCDGVAVLLGNGDGTFLSAVGYASGGLETGGLAVGDVNNDGLPDLVLTSNCQLQTCVGGTVTLLLGNGDGTFQAATQLSDSKGPVALGDVNHDGNLDLVTGAGVMLGDGDGTFQSPNQSVVDGALSIVLADVNNDTKLDIVAVVPNGVAVQLGNGDGTFQAAATFKTGGVNPLAVAIADFNGDNNPDLAVTNECAKLTKGECTSGATVGVLAGNGDGTFKTAFTYATGGKTATSVAAADADQDGKVDLEVANACTTVTNCTVGSIGILINDYLVNVSMGLTSSANPAVENQSVTFIATLTSNSAVPDGSPVTFTDGATTLATESTVSGVASLTASFATSGHHLITASYGGDLYHNSKSRTLSEKINP